MVLAQKMKTEIVHDIEIPPAFICPITHELMREPVISRYGQSYERSAIIEWLKSGHHSCPLTRQPLTLQGLVTNHQLRHAILLWQKLNNVDIFLTMESEQGDCSPCYITVPELRKQCKNRIVARLPNHNS